MEPIDIWRSAKVMIDQHGGLAPQECLKRAEAPLAAGNTDGGVAWEAIRRAAESLLEKGPPTDTTNA